MFMSQFNQDLIDFYLMFIYSLVGIRPMCLMTLQLQIIIFSKQLLEPQHGFFGSMDISVHYLLRDLSTQTSRTDNQPFPMLFQQFLINTRTSVETFRP